MNDYTIQGNPFASGLKAGAGAVTGIQNAIAGGSPLELAVARVGKGEDPTTILQELMQSDPQAAQQFMQYMQQMNGGGQQPQQGGIGGVMGQVGSALGFGGMGS